MRNWVLKKVLPKVLPLVEVDELVRMGVLTHKISLQSLFVLVVCYVSSRSLKSTVQEGK